LSNIVEISLDICGKFLKLSADLWVRIDEFFDILLDDLVVSGNLLELFVVHVEFPHFETLSINLKSLLDFKVESLHLCDDGLDLSLIFLVLEHLSGLLKSLGELGNLSVEHLFELFSFSFDHWVGVVELLDLLTEFFILSFDLLELLVVHRDGPHRLGLWGEDLARGADGTSEKHHDCVFHFFLVFVF